MKKDDICFEYERLFGVPYAPGEEVLTDLLKRFSHANGEFVADDNGGRMTAFNLGQASVIKYIVNQLNIAKQRAKEVN